MPSQDAESRRSLELDALGAILPIDRRDKLAAILTDDDVETLKFLAREGMGENTLRALASDLAYLEAWSLAANGGPLPWPASAELVLKFVAHHFWDPATRDGNPGHGMPAAVERALRDLGNLRANGPHAPSTVRRRLASWATLHRFKGFEHAIGAPIVKAAIRLAARASARPRRRKSKKAVTRDVLDQVLATCGSDRLADTRDRAILLLAFASGAAGAARSRNCESSSCRTNRPSRSILKTKPPLPCPAWRSRSAGRRRPKRTMTMAGFSSSAARWKRFENGSSERTSPRARSSGRSTAGKGSSTAPSHLRRSTLS